MIKTDNITIPIHSFIISQQNFPYLNSCFEADSDKSWEILEKFTFPEKKLKVEAVNLSFVQLLYLASIKSDEKKSLFSEKELKILNFSYDKSFITTWSLKIGLIVNTALFAGIALFPLVPTTTANNQNGTLPSNATNQENGVSQTEKGLITAAAFIGVLTNAVSFFATGFAPDTSSNAFNNKQDLLEGIKNKFDNLAKRLLLLYFSKGKEEAKKIAAEIDNKILKTKCFEETQNKEKTKQILALMKESLLFIQKKQLPASSDLLIIINKKIA